ncbi:unnamed protein product [Urochloa humidicola]
MHSFGSAHLPRTLLLQGEFTGLGKGTPPARCAVRRPARNGGVEALKEAPLTCLSSGCCGASGGFTYRGRTWSTTACCGAAVGGGTYVSPIPIPVQVVTESFPS